MLQIIGSTGHYYACATGTCQLRVTEDHDKSGTRVAKFFDLEYHGWYSTCSVCGYVHYSGAGDTSCGSNKGKHDLDSNGVCIYCKDGREGIIDGISGGSGGGGGGAPVPEDTCTCNGSTSYEEDYRKVDNEVHALYYVCNICGGEWYDADYIHKMEKPTSNENGKHTASCEKDCGYTLTEDCDFENGTCTGCGQAEPITEIEITSTKYKIEGTYIYVQPTTKVSDLKSNITTNATEIKVYGNDIEVSNDTTNATGMSIELKNGDTNKVFTIIVKGDVNSDGKSDFKDLVKINKARLNKITLEEIYSLAADVEEDEILDIKDLSKINRFRLEKIKVL